MGETFHNLHPAIQNRLNRELYDNKPVHFRGTLCVKASFFGRFIGRLGRIHCPEIVHSHVSAAFSGGVCSFTGDQVVCDVIAYHEPGSTPFLFFSFLLR
jgi:hypothetical protein